MGFGVWGLGFRAHTGKKKSRGRAKQGPGNNKMNITRSKGSACMSALKLS